MREAWTAQTRRRDLASSSLTTTPIDWHYQTVNKSIQQGVGTLETLSKWYSTIIRAPCQLNCFVRTGHTIPREPKLLMARLTPLRRQLLDVCLVLQVQSAGAIHCLHWAYNNCKYINHSYYPIYSTLRYLHHWRLAYKHHVDLGDTGGCAV